MGENLKKLRPMCMTYIARTLAVCAVLVAVPLLVAAEEENIRPPAETTQPPAQPAEALPAQPPSP